MDTITLEILRLCDEVLEFAAGRYRDRLQAAKGDKEKTADVQRDRAMQKLKDSSSWGGRGDKEGRAKAHALLGKLKEQVYQKAGGEGGKRCGATLKNGHRCMRKTKGGPCYQHANGAKAGEESKAAPKSAQAAPKSAQAAPKSGNVPVGKLKFDREAYKVFKEAAKKWGESLDKKEKDVILKYTGELYKKINDGLRNDNLSKNDLKLVKTIDAAIEKGVIKEPITVYENSKIYRAANIPEVREAIETNNIKNGFSFTEKGFASTSIDEKVALYFLTVEQNDKNGAIFVINTKPGTKAGMIDDELFPEGAGEQEIILARNTKFVVSHTEDKMYLDKKIKYIYVDISSQGGD